MHIRIQGKQVQLIRNTYSKEKKRAVQKVIGHFPSWSRVPGADIWPLLNEGETAELQEWLQAQKDKDELYSKQAGADMATSSLQKIIRSVELLDEQKAAQVWEELGKLQKALKKAGFKRPQAPKEKQIMAGQPSLID